MAARVLGLFLPLVLRGCGDVGSDVSSSGPHLHASLLQAASDCGPDVAVLLYGPVALLDVVWLVTIRPLTPEEGVCVSCLLGYVIRYLFFAAFNEEIIKLFVIYRMFLSPMTNGLCVVGVPSLPHSSRRRSPSHRGGEGGAMIIRWNWKALVVYAVCAGAGMGTAENLYKVYLGGWFTALKRTFMPFHALAGA